MRRNDNRIAWGTSLLVFGVLFLLKQLAVFPSAVEDFIFDFRNLLLVFGLIFLIACKNKSIGLVIISVGLLFYLKEIIRWTKSLSEFIWPILLIGAGAIILFSGRRKKDADTASEIGEVARKKTTKPNKAIPLGDAVKLLIWSRNN